MNCPVTIPIDIFGYLASLLLVALVLAIVALAAGIENDPGPKRRR